MGVARLGPPGCGYRTPAVVVLGIEAAAAVKNQSLQILLFLPQAKQSK